MFLTHAWEGGRGGVGYDQLCTDYEGFANCSCMTGYTLENGHTYRINAGIMNLFARTFYLQNHIFFSWPNNRFSKNKLIRRYRN